MGLSGIPHKVSEADGQHCGHSRQGWLGFDDEDDESDGEIGRGGCFGDDGDGDDNGYGDDDGDGCVGEDDGDDDGGGHCGHSRQGRPGFVMATT